MMMWMSGLDRMSENRFLPFLWMMDEQRRDCEHKGYSGWAGWLFCAIRVFLFFCILCPQKNDGNTSAHCNCIAPSQMQRESRHANCTGWEWGREGKSTTQTRKRQSIHPRHATCASWPKSASETKCTGARRLSAAGFLQESNLASLCRCLGSALSSNVLTTSKEQAAWILTPRLLDHFFCV